MTIDAARAARNVSRSADDETILDRTADADNILLVIRFSRRGSNQNALPANTRPPQPDPVLIAALRKAHAML